MPLSTYTMGPGTLTLNAGADDLSCQVKACVVNPTENVESSDAIDVLCGERLEGGDTATYTWTLDVKFQQDLAASGVVAFSWDNAGVEADFEFIPSTAGARKVTGSVRIAPMALGGDVKARPESDVSWKITDGSGDMIAGTPTFADVV